MRKHALLLAVVLATATGCTDGPKAQKAVEGMGYTQVKTHGYSFFGCAQDDFVKTKFTAIDQRGQKVSGVFCSGLIFKGGTVRLD